MDRVSQTLPKHEEVFSPVLGPVWSGARLLLPVAMHCMSRNEIVTSQSTKKVASRASASTFVQTKGIRAVPIRSVE
jgi:hypothetical protein